MRNKDEEHWGYNLRQWYENLTEMHYTGTLPDEIVMHPETGKRFYDDWAELNPHTAAIRLTSITPIITSLYDVPVTYCDLILENVLALKKGNEVRWIRLGLLKDTEEIPVEFKIKAEINDRQKSGASD